MKTAADLLESKPLARWKERLAAAALYSRGGVFTAHGHELWCQAT
jgi:hypothetical protein